MENENKLRDVKYSLTALILEGASPLAFLLGMGLMRIGSIMVVPVLFLWLAAIIAPVVAVAIAIVSLCLGK